MLFADPDNECRLSDHPDDACRAKSNQFGLRMVLVAWALAMGVMMVELVAG
jgi:hypothetical protein